MFKRFGPFRLRWKYIITYVLVMVIPFSMLLAVFLSDQISVVQADRRNLYISYLAQCTDTLERQFSNVSFVAASILANQQLQWSVISSRDWEEIQVMGALKNHNTLNPMPGRVYLCFRRPRVMYSSDGKISMDAFGGYSLVVPHATMMDLEKWMFAGDGIRFRTLECGTAETSTLMISYTGTGSSGRDAAVLSVIPVKELLKHAREMLGEMKDYLAVVDERGRVVSMPKGLTAEETNRILKETETAEKTGETHLDGHIAYCRKLLLSGYRYALILPENLVGVSIFSAYPNLLLIATVLLLLGLFGATAIALIIYHPIKLIYRQVSADDAGFELETISNSLNRLKQENSQLKEQVSQTISYVVDSTAEQLLHGRIDAEQALRVLRENSAALDHRLFWVIVLDYDSCEALGDVRMRIAQTLTEFIRPEDMSLLMVEPAGRNQTITVLNADREETAEALFSRLEKQLTRNEHAGISAMTDGAQHISSAYEEALACASFLRDPSRTVTYWRDVASPAGESESQPEMLEQRLLLDLRENNLERSLALLKTLTGLAVSAGTESQQAALMHVLNAVITYAFSLNDFDLTREISLVFSDNPVGMAGAFANMTPLVQKICEMGERRASKAWQEFQQSISNFIIEHFCDQDFCLERIAERFGMSVYVASRYFSSNAGQSFKDMIGSMRMERAKLLLEETDFPLNEIVHSVGYIDVSSFIKKFRQNEGVTPGQYRNLKRSAK